MGHSRDSRIQEVRPFNLQKAPMPVQSREKKRRFLPEPVETSSRSSKDNPSIVNERGAGRSTAYPGKPKSQENHGMEQQGHSMSSLRNRETKLRPRTHIRYELEPHPTSQSPDPALTRNLISPRADQSSDGHNTSQRRFVPQLMETGKRSFRRQPTLEPLSSQESPWPGPRRNLERSCSSGDGAAGGVNSGAPHESRFSYSSLRQRHEMRRHSFRVPSLPVIPSSCSEASDGSSGSSRHPSPHISRTVSPHYTNVRNDRRESCDERVADYLLSLAARTAELQLQEQALAAFPNEQVYQPVDHFAIDREEDDSYTEEPMSHGQGEMRGRRRSSADLSWELEYMRRHKVEAEMRDRAMAGTKEPRISRDGVSTHMVPDNISSYLGNKRAIPNASPLRHAKSPPMLGDDLVFPQSLSPENTICEGYTDSEHKHGSHDSSGLWHASSRQGGSLENDGLWMGTCQVDKSSQSSVSVTVMPIMRAEVNDEETLLGGVKSEIHKSRESSTKACDSDGHNGPLRPEQCLSPEFDNGFVTQIYNYLSLGYPCVARYYDNELSEISGIPLSDLRRDDLNTDAKGYVSVTEDMEKRNSCMRWKALRIYIHEWAKQKPTFAEDDGILETWGVRERRGSWAG